MPSYTYAILSFQSEDSLGPEFLKRLSIHLTMNYGSKGWVLGGISATPDGERLLVALQLQMPVSRGVDADETGSPSRSIVSTKAARSKPRKRGGAGK